MGFLPSCGCVKTTVWMQYMKKKLDGNYTRMQRDILRKSWKQHSTKQRSLTSHLKSHPSKTNKTCGTQLEKQKRTHKWRSSIDPIQGRNSVGRQSRTYSHQLCVDTGCSLEDLLGAMDDRDWWGERVREIRVVSVTWWWWKTELDISHYLRNINWIFCMIRSLDFNGMSTHLRLFYG